jgi:hypothetical protein
MSERRSYYSSRQVIDLDEFLLGSDEHYLMCISKSMLYALRKMAKTRLLWPTTYAAEKYEQSYVLPSAAQMDQVDDIVSEWIAETEVIEMCNTALVSALDGIATAIRQSSCCFEGGAGGQQVNGDYYWGSETPLEAPTAFGPNEEFATEAEYNTHRCATANGIVNGVIGSLNGMGVLSLISLTATGVIAGIVGIGLIFVPPVAIISALLLTGFAVALFYSLANEIDDNKEYLVCGLYNAETAIGAYDWFKNAIEELAIDLGVLEVSLGPLLDVVMNLAPINTMNALFSNVGLPSIPGDLIDCATCEPRVLTLIFGSGPTPAFDTDQTFNSQPVGGYHAIAIRIEPDGCYDRLANLEFLTEVSTDGAYFVRDCDGVTIESGSDASRTWTVGLEKCGAWWEFDSYSPFSMNWRIKDDDCTP